MKKIIILRGVPGSGKTTKAKEIVSNFLNDNPNKMYHICSADNFFIEPESGKYEFNSKLLGQAHAWCRGNAYTACSLGVELILVDNTSTTQKEYQPYKDMAERFGYEFETCVVGKLDEQSLKEYANRNTHGVPLDAIRRMARRFQ